MAKFRRLGHYVFVEVDDTIPIRPETLRDQLILHSESGRELRVKGVKSAITTSGQQLVFAREGAIIRHPEHGVLQLEPAVYLVKQLREARPEEEAARTLSFGPTN